MQVFGGSPLTVPTFDNVADFCGIAGRSGMDILQMNRYCYISKDLIAT